MTTTDSAREGATPAGASTHRFQAEVARVLDLVIHSLYSHREIFLRELVSNAADAIDKLRFRSVTDHEILGDDRELEIRLVPDAKDGTLVIEDNGIGMTREELVENLGTIARSGSRRFLEALKEKGQGTEGLDLIGQFGVGFYSAFIVAERVEVTSLAAGATEAWRWESDASDTFTIEPVRGRSRRGTSIRLLLKDDAKEFLEESRLRELVRKYSDFVGVPIRLRVEHDGEESFEAVNRGGALWRRPKAEIKDEDYEEFYKHVAHDWEAPLERLHFTVEGNLSLTGLLFVPKRPPLDLFDPNGKRGIRLYVKRVFIMEDCEAILVPWLRFVRGIVDSDDLPLNVSREILQEDRVVRSIRKTVTGKVLSALEKLAEERPEDYRSFFEAFGAVLKEGFHFDRDQKDRLAKLARWASSKAESTGLADYVARMPAGQDAIYYAIGQTRRAVEGSPHLEGLAKKGYEVLYMTDAIDEWVVDSLREFEGKKLVSAMKAGLELEDELPADEKKKSEERKEELKGLAERAKEVLAESVSEVRWSSRLTDSPCCLVVPEGGLHAHIERMLRAQNRDMPAAKRILELNPGHPVIQRLNALNAKDPAGGEVADWLRLLLDQALLAEGSPIQDPARFAKRMADLMRSALGG